MFKARDWWRTTGFATDIKNAVDFDMFLKMSEVTEMKHVREWSYVYRIHEKNLVSESAIQSGIITHSEKRKASFVR